MQLTYRTLIIVLAALVLSACTANPDQVGDVVNAPQTDVSFDHSTPTPNPFKVSLEEAMKLTSTAFTDQGKIPAKYTCQGQDINPPLTIANLPPGTKSLAIEVTDPDAPAGTWLHWLVFNIDPKTSQINENSIPPGALQGQTSWGKPSWGGPCPPSGTHHYHFKLYALDDMLRLQSYPSWDDFKSAIKDHILSQTDLVGLFGH